MGIFVILGFEGIFEIFFIFKLFGFIGFFVDGIFIIKGDIFFFIIIGVFFNFIVSLFGFIGVRIVGFFIWM